MSHPAPSVAALPGQPGGYSVIIRTKNNFFWCAEDDGRLLANRTEAQAWEEFRVFPFSGMTFVLKSFHEKYVCVESNGYCIADRESAREWERLTFSFPTSSNSASIQSYHGTYLMEQYCRLETSPEPELFTILLAGGQQISLESSWTGDIKQPSVQQQQQPPQHCVCVSEDHKLVVMPRDGKYAIPPQFLIEVCLDTNKNSIQMGQGQFLTATPEGTVILGPTNKDPTSQFSPILLPNGVVGFRTCFDTFLGFAQSEVNQLEIQLVSCAKSIGNMEHFIISRMEGSKMQHKMMKWGRYEVPVTATASGAIGEVRIGFDPLLQRAVAIKKLKRVDHAIDEAKNIAAISPGSNQFPIVYDFMEWGTEGYVVMSVIHGVTLRQILQKNGWRMSEPMTVKYTLSILHALHHMHCKGFVYADMKLDNMLVDDEGTCHIVMVDFGTAVPLDGKPEWIGSIRGGTPSYMGIEQFGRPALVDVTTDLYGVGMLCAELIFGQTPTDMALHQMGQGSSKDMLALHTSGVPLPSQKFCSEQLRAILQKAIQPSRENRYQSAATFIQDLQKLQ